MKCAECGQACSVIAVNESFDHAFGTETRIYPASACCEASITDDDGQPLSDQEVERAAMDAAAADLFDFAADMSRSYL